MSFLEKHAKAAVFFVLGVMVSGIVVGTTLYADAQFGASRFRPGALQLTFISQKQELTPQALAFVVAKCATTDRIVSGGYDLAIGGADPAKVYVLAALPEPGENGYKVYVANASSNTINVFSYAQCTPR
jgi:hypothetical protein